MPTPYRSLLWHLLVSICLSQELKRVKLISFDIHTFYTSLGPLLALVQMPLASYFIQRSPSYITSSAINSHSGASQAICLVTGEIFKIETINEDGVVTTANRVSMRDS